MLGYFVQAGPPLGFELDDFADFGYNLFMPEKVDLSFFKLLVAEDNEVNQILLDKMLTRLGIPHKIVADGTALYAQLMEERYDLVLMDCYMAPMSGFDAAQKIRNSNERFAQMPLIGFTASSSAEDRQRCLDAGMNDILLKPVTMDQLREKLQEWASKIYEALPVLDDSSIDKIRMFDDEEQSLVKSLLQIYSETTQEELMLLKDLIAKDDIDGVRKKAHRLKSSAAQLGAMRFEKYCNLMEYEESLNQARAEKLFAEMYDQYKLSREKFQESCQFNDQNPSVSL
ncbi:MAG: response regulator [Proteobacteria bacterium]|nr:MAG: response regulator [Pseudomonadota bacterium]